jgi:hypothetical protein
MTTTVEYRIDSTESAQAAWLFCREQYAEGKKASARAMLLQLRDHWPTVAKYHHALAFFDKSLPADQVFDEQASKLAPVAGGRNGLFPKDHPLQHTQAAWRRYGRAFPEIANSLSQRLASTGKKARIVDVGADAGAMALAVNAAEAIDILCLDATQENLPYLQYNAGLIGPQITVVPEPFNPRMVAGPGLAQVLVAYPHFASADLLKIGMASSTFDILLDSIDWLAAAAPSLFFEFNPFTHPNAAADALRTVDRLLDAGYDRFFVFDNFGNLIGEHDAASEDCRARFQQFVSWLDSHRRHGTTVYYLDVLAVHAKKDQQWLEPLRQQWAIAPQENPGAQPEPELRVAARAALQRGNLPLADLLVRAHLADKPADAKAWRLLGEVALHLQLPLVASDCFRRMATLQQQGAGDLVQVLDLMKPHLVRPPITTTSPKYLLIKAWGHGFWSDIDHVMGQLLVAELTGRMPVVSWGNNSLFGNGQASNAFELYFEAVSMAKIDDLGADALSYFPPKWNKGNLLDNANNQWSGPHSRQCGITFLGRHEDVVVSDFHTPIVRLIPWIDASSPYAAMNWMEIYRTLFAKYLRLKPAVAQAVDAYYERHLKGHRWLAVHIRGSDKVTEQRDLADLNASYHPLIEQYLAADPALKIFLLTDSTTYLAEFGERYGDRVHSIDAQRSDSNQGVHLQGHSGQEIGNAVLLDCYLATRCEYFIGNGGSNVSAAIGSLKDWESGSFHLLGRDLRSSISIFVHNW